MNIKNLKPNKNSIFKQDYYKPINPKKYIGDINSIIYRSSWEYKFMTYLDVSESVVLWSSEPTYGIPYFNPIKNKTAKYYIDFYAQIKDESGNITEYLFEIKPVADYRDKPQMKGKITEKKAAIFKRQAETYIINNAKFKAAEAFAKASNRIFKIITEEELFPKKKS